MSYEHTRRAARALQPVPELADGEVWVVDTEPTRYHLDRCSSVRAADHGHVLDVVAVAELDPGRVLCGLCAVVYGHTPPHPLPGSTPPPPAAQTPPHPPATSEGGRG